MGTFGVAEDGSITAQLDAEGVSLAKRLTTARAAIKHWEAEVEECRARLVKLMGAESEIIGHYEGYYAGMPVLKINVHQQNRFDSRAFREDHADLYQRYTRPLLITTVTVPDALSAVSPG